MSDARALIDAEDPKTFLKRVATTGWRAKPIDDGVATYAVTLFFNGQEQHNVILHDGKEHAPELEAYLNWLLPRHPYTEVAQQSWIPDFYIHKADLAGWPEEYIKATGKPAFKRAGKTGLRMTTDPNEPRTEPPGQIWASMPEAEDPKRFLRQVMPALEPHLTTWRVEWRYQGNPQVSVFDVMGGREEAVAKFHDIYPEGELVRLGPDLGEAEDPKHFLKHVAKARKPVRLIKAYLSENPPVYEVTFTRRDEGIYIEILTLDPDQPGYVNIHPYGPFTEEEMRQVMNHPAVALVNWSERQPVEEAEDPKQFLKRTAPRPKWVIKAETTNGRVFMEKTGRYTAIGWSCYVTKDTAQYADEEQAKADMEGFLKPEVIARHLIVPFQLTPENIRAEAIHFTESEDPKRFLQRYGRDFVYMSDGTVYYVTALHDNSQEFLDTVSLPVTHLKSDQSIVIQPQYLQQFLALAGEAGFTGRRVNEVEEAEDPKSVFKLVTADSAEHRLRKLLTSDPARYASVSVSVDNRFFLSIETMGGHVEMDIGPFRRDQLDMFRNEWYGFRDAKWEGWALAMRQAEPGWGGLGEAEDPKSVLRQLPRREWTPMPVTPAENAGWQWWFRSVEDPKVWLKVIRFVSNDQKRYMSHLFRDPDKVSFKDYWMAEQIFSDEEAQLLAKRWASDWLQRYESSSGHKLWAAIQLPGGKVIHAHSNSHEDAEGEARRQGFLDTDIDGAANGYLTDQGKFVLRDEGYFLPWAAGRRADGSALAVGESKADDIAKEAEKAEQPKSAEQADAGNQKKGHIHLHGWAIAIENAKDSVRKSKDPDNPWQVTMPAHYGYIKGTEGKDKDHIDVYIGEHPTSMLAFVVNQVKKEGGAFDEHKIMLGFKTKDEAIATYDAAFNGDLGPKLRKSVVSATIDQVKLWLDKGDTKKEYANLEEAESPLRFIKKVAPRGNWVVWLELAGPGGWKGYWTMSGAISQDKTNARQFVSRKEASDFIARYTAEHGAPVRSAIQPALTPRQHPPEALEAEDPKAAFKSFPRHEWAYTVNWSPERDKAQVLITHGPKVVNDYVLRKDEEEFEDWPSYPDSLGQYWVDWYQKLDVILPYRPEDWDTFLDWYEKAYHYQHKKAVGEGAVPEKVKSEARALIEAEDPKDFLRRVAPRTPPVSRVVRITVCLRATGEYVRRNVPVVWEKGLVMGRHGWKAGIILQHSGTPRMPDLPDEEWDSILDLVAYHIMEGPPEPSGSMEFEEPDDGGSISELEWTYVGDYERDQEKMTQHFGGIIPHSRNESEDPKKFLKGFGDYVVRWSSPNSSGHRYRVIRQVAGPDAAVEKWKKIDAVLLSRFQQPVVHKVYRYTDKMQRLEAPLDPP